MAANKLRAAQTVLATYELLERILLFVPMNHVYTLQRTCKSWNSLITRSHAIQKKLFRLPDGAPTKSKTPGPYMTPWNLTVPEYRLENRKCNPNIGLVFLEHITHREEAFPILLPDLNYSPPARPTITAIRSSVHNELGETDITDLKERALMLEMKINDTAPLNSWHEMFITQPPITAVLFGCHSEVESYQMPLSGNSPSRSHVFQVWNAGGVRFVDLAFARKEFVMRQGGKDGWTMGLCFDLTGKAVSEKSGREMEEECCGKYTAGEECQCLEVVREEGVA
ncbi:uncharacterized protein CLAFUR5_05217 [Fulvia fulva]|uniref:F-box domain-containing protein n=1 Tax=Passalora fulva TaxID=5499 RepID=A0A9Q8LHB4_PASFU|nr:uncharacterized protein CLAFUR5_05217 [Fulvia fulva]KAK4616759.1 hypothetical protein CLAFUR0_10635 [Fulvia fulva]UJO17169.1 hypothetical protein CLAFUR5_05217 [Fulvia fulva]